jgi:hypothetical protein
VGEYRELAVGVRGVGGWYIYDWRGLERHSRVGSR